MGLELFMGLKRSWPAAAGLLLLQALAMQARQLCAVSAKRLQGLCEWAGRLMHDFDVRGWASVTASFVHAGKGPVCNVYR